jgi:hypothetical protein
MAAVTPPIAVTAVAETHTGLLRRTNKLLHFDDQLRGEYRTIRPFALVPLRHSG